MFKIGDKVKVVDDGMCHDTYTRMYNRLKLHDSKPFKNEGYPNIDEIAIIRNIGNCEYSNNNLYLIETDELSFIFGYEGLELCNNVDDKKEVSTLTDRFGIQDGQEYYIFYRHEERSESKDSVVGEILNFCPAQVVLKSDKGLYILSPKNIIEMCPVKRN